MGRQRHTAEEIINKLREAEVGLAWLRVWLCRRSAGSWAWQSRLLPLAGSTVA